MPTTAQILANRLNSQKSTEPRTAEDKAAVSQNAVKHGLFASEAVITGENQADYELFCDEMIAEFQKLQLLRQLQKEDDCEAEPAQAIPKACGFEVATRHLPAKKKGRFEKTKPICPGPNRRKVFCERRL